MAPRRDWDPDQLGRYLEGTSPVPPARLAQQIKQRIALEPPSTPPRRFRAAVRYGDVRAIWRTLGQNATAAVAPRTSSTLRLQAISVVVAFVLTVSVGGAGVLATAGVMVNEVIEPIARSIQPATGPAPASVSVPPVQRATQWSAGAPQGAPPGAPPDCENWPAKSSRSEGPLAFTRSIWRMRPGRTSCSTG